MRSKNNLILMVFSVVTAVTFFFLRFYHIENRIIFDFDQESFSRAVYDILHNHHLTLIGPRVLSDKGFFLGPYFIYALVPFYVISRLHPYGLMYFLVVYNLIFFAGAALLISRQWSKPHAIFFLMAWATNALIVRYDTTPWNPISIPLGVLIVWYLLRQITVRNLLRDWVLLGLTLGLFFNQHFQFAFLIFFSMIFLAMCLYNNRKLYIGRILALVAAFLATYIPLFLFDLRHGFLNIKLFISFFTEDIGGNIEHGRLLWIDTYAQIFQPIIGYKDPVLALTFYTVFALALIYLIQKKMGFLKMFYKSTLILWLVLPFLFALYNKRITDYYLMALYPFIYITLIDSLMTSKRHILLTIGLVLILYLNYSQFKLIVKPNPLSMAEKDYAIRVMKRNVRSDATYFVSFNMPPGLATGYSYLLEWYGINPVNTPGAPLIEFNIPKKDGDVDVNDAIGIKIPPEVRK